MSVSIGTSDAKAEVQARSETSKGNGGGSTEVISKNGFCNENSSTLTCGSALDYMSFDKSPETTGLSSSRQPMRSVLSQDKKVIHQPVKDYPDISVRMTGKAPFDAESNWQRPMINELAAGEEKLFGGSKSSISRVEGSYQDERKG
ncbi:hypothetical protein EJ05DRAFT_498590 [Pseudovirgaria hyperparasitica]|uniref:Uncharacterized protein n=1 Tax=Pseudovirgaria hyperparasitica TaxID=470096 RepID=A0A6A6WG87_9PEZI|nr:uncharacterized protein EJ05DRAFT_498590 [Pseudovirgaria hyperparasitica]KAF2760637.1 hypothetical protein EJ05DRAFT_498590 [Pseudovirgaria hyperparasitica]